MGGLAQPLGAVPWIWHDEVRLGGMARVRLVCGHCDTGCVLSPDVRWVSPPPGTSLLPSLRNAEGRVANMPLIFVQLHKSCEDRAIATRRAELGNRVLWDRLGIKNGGRIDLS
jgi:hypothetical protein